MILHPPGCLGWDKVVRFFLRLLEQNIKNIPQCYVLRQTIAVAIHTQSTITFFFLLLMHNVRIAFWLFIHRVHIETNDDGLHWVRIKLILCVHSVWIAFLLFIHRLQYRRRLTKSLSRIIIKIMHNFKHIEPKSNMGREKDKE